MNQKNNATLDAAAEAELLARAQQGEERAFEALFDAYGRRVYSLCLRMGGSGAEAEGLTQEVFLTVFKKISTFPRETTFATWLDPIVINVVLTHLRKKRFVGISLDEAGSRQPGAGEALCSQRSAEQRMDRIALDEAIASLPLTSGDLRLARCGRARA